MRITRTKIAFTLAEVLITLGIIGVVAAITIPTLMQNIQDTQFKSAWKKEYSQLEQASKLYLQDNSNNFSGVGNYADALQPYYKIIKYCNSHASVQGCWVTSGTNLYLKPAWGYVRAGIPDNSANPDLGVSQGLVLTDGTLVSTFAPWSAACDPVGSLCGWIIVDVNGIKIPNTVGRDIFGVWVLKDRITPIGSEMVSTGYNDACGNGDNTAGDSGWGCSAEYLKNSNRSVEELVSMVASKGGTTEATLKAFEEMELAKVFEKGIRKGVSRSKELASR